ncbi:MAG: hypothetical protein E7300_08180 [Lachnospiraceae bacterium]|jgi:cell division septum initiation protein DivIVA|nr:hypothetical protein [Lachnospiraceae bacterium]
MSSKIEQCIDEIEEYIDSCKYQALSQTKIIVNKETIDELLRELRMKTPDELKRVQKIISNQEAILNDAKKKAEALIEAATVQTNELISEHEIMQQAYAQANEVVTLASQQAKEILDNATREANEVRTAAMQYTDDMLGKLEAIISESMNGCDTQYRNLLGVLKNCDDIVHTNRMELHPEMLTADEADMEGGSETKLSVDMI